jgi:DNA polymerase-3 subunit chi
MTGETTEVLFYHLENCPLEQVLPSLLERTLQRGWKAVVQVGAVERLEPLDLALWTYADESFLPHGTVKDGHADLQPVILTAEDDNPNGATIRFLVDGADLDQFAGYVRVVYIFDGNDPYAVDCARAAWKRAKAQACQPTYWQQGRSGGWEKKG